MNSVLKIGPKRIQGERGKILQTSYVHGFAREGGLLRWASLIIRLAESAALRAGGRAGGRTGPPGENDALCLCLQGSKSVYRLSRSPSRSDQPSPNPDIPRVRE